MTHKGRWGGGLFTSNETHSWAVLSCSSDMQDTSRSFCGKMAPARLRCRTSSLLLLQADHALLLPFLQRRHLCSKQVQLSFIEGSGVAAAGSSFRWAVQHMEHAPFYSAFCCTGSWIVQTRTVKLAIQINIHGLIVHRWISRCFFRSSTIPAAAGRQNVKLTHPQFRAAVTFHLDLQ